MVDTQNSGILTNVDSVYNGVDYRNPETTTVIYGEQYNNGMAIQGVGAGNLIFDTGTIAPGTFSGLYDIGIFYDCQNYDKQGQELMRWALYENGSLVPETKGQYAGSGYVDTEYGYDLNTIDNILSIGIHTTYKFKPDATYRITITTSANISTRVGIVNFVSLHQMGENGFINSKPIAQRIGARNATAENTEDITDFGTKLVMEVVVGGIGFTSLAYPGATRAGYTFHTPYTSVQYVSAEVYDTNGGVGTALYSIDLAAQTVTIVFRNLTGGAYTLSGTNNLRIFMVGTI